MQHEHIYIQHQYEALTKNASPQNLLLLAEQLKTFAESQIVTVDIGIWVDNGDYSGHTVNLNVRDRLNKALDLIVFPLNTEVKHIGYYYDPDPNVRYTAYAEDLVEAGAHYAIYVNLKKRIKLTSD